MKYATKLFIESIREVIAPFYGRAFIDGPAPFLDRNGTDRGLDSEVWIWLGEKDKPEELTAALRREGFSVEEKPVGRCLVIRRGTAVFKCPRCKGERYQVNAESRTGRKKLCSFCHGSIVPQGVPQGVSYDLRLYVASIREVLAADPSIGDVTFGLSHDGGLDTEATLVMDGDAAGPVTLMLRASGFEVARLLSDDHPALLTVRRGTAVFPCPRCKGASSERRPSDGKPPCGFCLRRDLTPEETPPC